MKDIKIRDMVLIALFAALTSIGAYLTIPLEPVPITLQVMFCLLAGILLGRRLAVWSQILYVLIGLVGLPVFAGGSGGVACIFKPSFGFVLGFVAGAYVTGRFTERFKHFAGFKGIIGLFFVAGSGLCAIYLLGLSYMYMILTVYLGKTISVMQLLTLGFFPFIALDLLKCIAVAMIGYKVIPVLRKSYY